MSDIESVSPERRSLIPAIQQIIRTLIYNCDYKEDFQYLKVIMLPSYRSEDNL